MPPRRALACPACRRGRTEPFLELGEAPAFCNVQWASRSQAQEAVQGPLSLHACLDCAHVFNAAFDPARMAYAPGYENSQHGSSVFRDYAERLVDRLVATYAIRDRSVVDIGCGRGDLLGLFCERGGNRGFGFDPSYAGPSTPRADVDMSIRREYFGPEQAAAIRPSLVNCRHVLEHVEDPVAFLQSLRGAIQAGGETVLYIEVPSGEELLSSLGLWDYLYEHVSYFSAQSLRSVLEAAGFEILRMYRDFGGQFLCADARVASRSLTSEPGEGVSEALIRESALGMVQRLEEWRRWARELPSGGRVSLWGAGSKGVMFLNLLGLAAPDVIDTVVDQNTDKHGRFVSGTGQRIIAPEALRSSGVEQIVLMNRIYESEVRARLADMSVAAELQVAWP
jgi:SAM-dependent methyltransferase